MKKILSAVLAGLLGLGGVAHAGTDSQASFNILYDIDSTDPIYCLVTGIGGSPWLGPIPGARYIKTTGSSTTTDAVTASVGTFAGVDAGDILSVALPDGTTLLRYVISKASNDQVVVNSAWNLSATGGHSFGFLNQTCGTGANDGWIDVSNSDSFAITFELDQVNTTGGINVQVQCTTGAPNASPVQIFPACTSGACGTYQAYAGVAGITSATTIAVGFPYKKCRVSLDIVTADDGADTTTAAEQIDVSLIKHITR